MSEIVIVSKSCPDCGKQIEAEIPKDDFFETALHLYKATACMVCCDLGLRIRNLARLKSEAWTHLKRLEVRKGKAECSARYGQRGASESIRDAIEQISELREQIETLEGKEQKATSEFKEYKEYIKEQKNEKKV